MNKSLNLPVLEDALIKAGMNQTDLALKLNLTRAAVSKWFQNESFPAPDKLLRMGMLLGLAFEQLVLFHEEIAAPIVSFRKKAARKTKDVHLDRARETGVLLRRLVSHLPQQELTQPPTLKNPAQDYAYLQRVADDVRKDMGLEEAQGIKREDLIDKFNSLHAILIPVLWGSKEHHGNALNIHLPDSKTTWVFLNLDSNEIDFKFWMAHELGHSLAPTLAGNEGEDFADGFAQALLFPEPQVIKLRRELALYNAVGARINCIRAQSAKQCISPLTIRCALEAYEKNHALPLTDLGTLSDYMGGVKNFSKDYSRVSKILLETDSPPPAAYIKTARSVFESPFFEALRSFCRTEQGSEHYIRTVLGVSLTDAKALSGELRK